MLRLKLKDLGTRFRGPREMTTPPPPVGGPSPSEVTPETVAWAYRLFLGREPESWDEAEARAAACPDIPSLRAKFVSSREFRENNAPALSAALHGDEPPMRIEAVDSERDLATILDHIARTWQFHGETEPHWSVITADMFASDRIDQTKDEFYNSGLHPASHLFKTLERNGVDAAPLRTCLEYGCGLGRVTRWLAERFDRVYGYDISAAHLQGAEEHLSRSGVTNVTLRRIESFDSLSALERVDLVYSLIVLQHNPPPVIRLIVRAFLRALNPGGIAFFQVPTYRQGYTFSKEAYLGNEATRHEMMEMHVLPQSQVFEIVRQEDCQVLEVLEDGWTCFRHKEVSNSFLIRKPA